LLEEETSQILASYLTQQSFTRLGSTVMRFRCGESFIISALHTYCQV